MTTVTDVVNLLAQRRAERSALTEMARLISRHYNNHIAIPLPELDEREAPAVANLIAQGIDQHALRVASTLPDVKCPPVKVNKGAEDRAKHRRMAAYGWYEINEMDLVMKKRARQLVAYAHAPVLIRPDARTRQPKWEPKPYLDTYIPPATDVIDFHPRNAIFTFARTWAWLARRYPAVAMTLAESLDRMSKPSPDDLIECAWYQDEYEHILVAIGRGRLVGMTRQANYGIADEQITLLTGQGKNEWAAELAREPNLVGMTTVVSPHRINLDDPKGQFDDTTGIFAMQAKLMALEVNAVARSVYPDLWFIKDPNGNGQITRVADGLTGVIGEVDGGGKLQEIQTPPNLTVANTINYLERSLRQNSAMPADFGGESASNIRTDRRGQAVLAATVDFFIDEHQKILARSMKSELEIAAAIDLAYYADLRKSFYVSWGKKPGRLDYTPRDLWTEDRTFLVNFTYAGLDRNAKTIEIGQKVAAGLLSVESGMEQDPTVEDVQKELARVRGEALERALMSSIEQQAATGAITPSDVARIVELMRPGNITLEQAVSQVQAEAQARQASSGAPGTPEGPVAPGAPEAQPGLAQPGMGQEQPTAAPVPPAAAGPTNLRHILSTLTAGRSLANMGG